MELLTNEKILESLASTDDDSLFIDPLLDENQIGGVTVDLRLGYDFLVSILTRKPAIELGSKDMPDYRGIGSYFQETRRDLGDTFILYPGQLVLGTSLEYLSIPSDIYADILSRSSYTRLGIHMNSMVQPGFRGCIPLELFNHGNNAVELVVGSRICQARFFKLSDQNFYVGNERRRKYYGDVRPTVSKADDDHDLGILAKIATDKTL